MGGYTQTSKLRCAERQKQPRIYTDLQGQWLNPNDKTDHTGRRGHGENSVKNAVVNYAETAREAVQCRTSLVLPFPKREKLWGTHTIDWEHFVRFGRKWLWAYHGVV